MITFSSINKISKNLSLHFILKYLSLGILTVSLVSCSTSSCRNRSNKEDNQKSMIQSDSTTENKISPSPQTGLSSPSQQTSEQNPSSDKELKMKPLDTKNKSSSADRVWVYKLDGSQQCGMKKGISIEEMQKDLKEIPVYSSKSLRDGLMRITMCGASSGQSNVYEIDRDKLSLSKKYGFKEWTFDL